MTGGRLGVTKATHESTMPGPTIQSTGKTGVTAAGGAGASFATVQALRVGKEPGGSMVQTCVVVCPPKTCVMVVT